VSTAGWIDTAYVGILPDFRQFQRELRGGMDRALRDSQRDLKRYGDRIERDLVGVARRAGRGVTSEFRDTARQADRALRQIGGPGAFRGLTRQAETASGQIERSFRGAQVATDRRMSGLKLAVAGAGAGLLGVLGAVGLAAGKAGLEVADGMQQARISFKTLLGGAKEADRFLRDLTRFANTTPFELPGLVESSRQLVGAGLSAKGTMGALKALGEASGALGLKQEQYARVVQAVSQALNDGRLRTEELQQITEAGLPVWPILARALGKPVAEVRKLAEAGKLNSRQVLPELFAQMQKDYGGAMEEQSRTLSGRLSTFKDTVLTTIAEALAPLAQWMTDRLPAAGETLKASITGIRNFLRDDLNPELQKTKQSWDDNKAAFQELIAAFDAGGDDMALLRTVFHRVGEEVRGLIDLLGWLARAFNFVIRWGRITSHLFDVVLSNALRAWVAVTLNGFRLVLRGMATMAETLHLPLAKSLRKAEQDMRKFATGANVALDSIDDEKVKITASFGWQGLKVFRVGGPRGAFAGGGEVDGPGTSTSDSIHARLSKGEHVWTAREVAGVGGHRAVERLRRRAVGRYAGGGPVGRYADGGGLTATLELPAQQELRGSLARFRRRIGQVLDDVTAALRRELKRAGLAGIGGNLGGWVAQAIALTGVPPSWAPALVRRAMFESGGNPRAVNLWDINAARGHPSMGLMQTIGPTFNAYKWNGLGDIFNPVHNLVAAIRYILARYGSIFAIDPPVRGYDRGGVLRPGQAGVNRSGRPELVLSPEQTAAVGAGAGRGFHVGVVNVYAAPDTDTARVRTAVLDTFEALFDEWRRGGVS
jgi:tape measure domain-containing protein